jgi:GTP pyrophosphokinase
VADCCKPIPGDDVIAFIDEGGRSVTLHKRNCPLANKLKANFGERIVQADWKSMNSASFPVILQIQGVDVMGVLLQLVSTFTNSDVNVDEIHSISRDGMFDCKIRVLVHNIEVVNELTNELLKIKPVQSVHRLDDVRI